MLNISARFADPDEAAALKGKGFQGFAHDFGEVLIYREPLRTADTVTLGLSRFFKKITVDGIYST